MSNLKKKTMNADWKFDLRIPVQTPNAINGNPKGYTAVTETGSLRIQYNRDQPE